MVDNWQYSTIHNSVCKVIEEQTLWGQAVCRVWLPNQDAVVRVPMSSLQPLDHHVHPEIESHRIAYITAAAKVAEVLEGSFGNDGGQVLLAPMESNVIPLPHQIQALSRAISKDRIRYLLADEVGLGKTIEAGLIMRELKLRGLVRRILVVAPKGLASQWVSEMRTHFNEHFQLVLGEDLSSLQRMKAGEQSTYWASSTGLSNLDLSDAANPWHVFDQVIVSQDSVKPMDKRRGWTKERIDAYNRTRFEDLISAGWDLVVVDEAHRLGGSSEQVARYKLGKGLSEAAPYLLLLSATPHQGKTDAFHRIMNLLDEKAFPDEDSVTRDRVTPYIIRTEKRKAIDADGKALFKPRRTEMIPVVWQEHHNLQEALYEAVTDYVRDGYNQAILDKKHHIGFLMILMQRLVVSSTRAIRTTLERRLAVLQHQEKSAQERLHNDDASEDIQELSEEELSELYDRDGQELLDELLKSRVSALKSEVSTVKLLLDASTACEHAAPDAKAEELIDRIYQLQSVENDPELKVLIFTEFVPTQQMLREFLEARGISVATLNGSMDMQERKQAQDAFRRTHRVLVSTDAGGEGLNLQFAHVVINYDIPWNPMRLEQRIGRVDRIGQPKTVRAINFVFENSVEFRVREVLEEKLSVIFHEFGIDKTGDVLDSAQAGALFEDVFTQAILHPDEIETKVEETTNRIRDEIKKVREMSAIYGISDEPNVLTAERLRSHPLPHWVEQMTVGYLKSHGGDAVQKRSWWDLRFTNGLEVRKAVFSAREAERLSDATLLNLENNQIRGLAMNLPQVASGQPIPCVRLAELPATLSGFWGLYEIRIQSGLHTASALLRIPAVRRGYLCVFRSEEGKIFVPTARHIWDLLQTTHAEVIETMASADTMIVSDELQAAAETSGREVFESMRLAHLESIEREEERGSVSFTARKKAIEKVGLPEVRQFRMNQCVMDETEWRKQLQAAKEVLPEMRPLLVLRILSGVA
jgi:superfamily II DNA or RNA helicase